MDNQESTQRWRRYAHVKNNADQQTKIVQNKNTVHSTTCMFKTICII
jgi:hypothetical protein